MSKLFKNGFIYLVLMLLIFSSISIGSASAAERVDYEEGVTNLNNTLENNTQIGQQLQKPETGWKRFDDTFPALKYSGGWEKFGTSSAFGGNDHRTSVGEQTLTFTFEGTKLRIISPINNNLSSEMTITIDDVVEKFSIRGTSLQWQTLVYEKIGLTQGKHNVTISTSNTGINIVDAIDIDESGYIVTPIGSPLLQPEQGWKRFDSNDPAIQYSSGWTLFSSSSDYGNSDYRTSKSGETIKFKFYGTKLRIISPINYDLATEVTITIDGSSEKFNLQNSSVQWQTFIYEKLGLVKGEHNVIISTSSTGITVFDAIDVDGKLLDENEVPSVESITLDKNEIELIEGSQDKLTATVLPENATNKKVVWTSSDDSIATVDQNGNVTALREGQAIITAKVENTELVATATVIVKKLNNESSNAILSITLVNGITKEYDVTNTVLNNYLNWFESAQGTSTFKFSKTISPYKKVTEYIVHDKIASFEVREY
ncbi:Ig-like domain-containing protein [Lysinibacillus xylanilyticus]|uniref:Ig-like domain-containing protein n=1 Tax=Lysinibacillus xylanilyticus TaxID=582475 RepID=A0ABT4ENN5_9BACI|nr:Ig-like domain-containing protein [Lysinibacillus xylanilyticus]MCY9547274.1 Ig-like domain-containing protein [Lysinibacillus xylanilyticus]